MKRKPYTAVASVFLAVITLMHMARMLAGWSILVEGWHVPLWLNALGAIVTGTLSVMLWKESRS